MTGRALGFWMCTALVVGNMIGSGVFLLPAALAAFGWAAMAGWLLTIAGAMCLAFVFARLAAALPEAGGPYAYCRLAFGERIGFAVAWSYWLSIVIGNAALAVAALSYLSAIVPAIGRISGAAPLLALGIVWLFTLVNCLGVRSVGSVQLAATILKLLPIAAVAVVAVVAIAGGAQPVVPLRLSGIGFGQVTGAATISLWALLGLESATVPADKVKDARRTIPRATLAGTAFVGLAYLLICSAIQLMLPPVELAASPAPFALFLDRFAGGRSGTVVAAFAALSALGALNGWVLLQGELPSAMARTGMFPRWLAHLSANGTPVRAHAASALILTVVVALNFQRSLVDLFTFIVLLSTTGSLFAYLFSAAGAILLQRRGVMPASPLLALVAGLAALYSGWAIWGAGREPALLGVALLLSAWPVHALMRARMTPEPAPAR